MPIVVDANLLVALVSGDSRGAAVSQQILLWEAGPDDLHAPALAPFEVANALAQLIWAKAFPADQVSSVWARLTSLPISFHPLADGPRVVEIAGRLKRRSAYDAAYLALSEQLQAELWTLDGALFRNAADLGFPVRLLQSVPGAGGA